MACVTLPGSVGGAVVAIEITGCKQTRRVLSRVGEKYEYTDNVNLIIII